MEPDFEHSDPSEDDFGWELEANPKSETESLVLVNSPDSPSGSSLPSGDLGGKQ